jgi:hypothetical protein
MDNLDADCSCLLTRPHIHHWLPHHGSFLLLFTPITETPEAVRPEVYLVACRSPFFRLDGWFDKLVAYTLSRGSAATCVLLVFISPAR